MAHRTILAGATVVQLKVTIPTDELVERGFGFRSLLWSSTNVDEEFPLSGGFHI
jgi:hypothetical protein